LKTGLENDTVSTDWSFIGFVFFHKAQMVQGSRFVHSNNINYRNLGTFNIQKVYKSCANPFSGDNLGVNIWCFGLRLLRKNKQQQNFSLTR